MPLPADPALVAKAIELAKRLGTAEAAFARLKGEGYAVTPRGVRNWIAKAGRPASTKSSSTPSVAPPAQRLVKVSPRSKLPPAPAGVATPPPKAGPAAAVRPKAADRSELPPDLDVDLDPLGWEGLARLVPIVARYRSQAETDDAPKVFDSMVRLEMDVHDRLERLRPAPPVDPETDPTNLDAAELLLRKLNGLVAAAAAEAPT